MDFCSIICDNILGEDLQSATDIVGLGHFSDRSGRKFVVDYKYRI